MDLAMRPMPCTIGQVDLLVYYKHLIVFFISYNFYSYFSVFIGIVVCYFMSLSQVYI